MAELKYTYALDKNENCIGIENAQKGIEYRCPHCKGEMVVKEGSIKVNAERKSKVDDNTAKMQSIKWLGV